MLLIFVHGWSVTSTETYGGLPEALALNAPKEMNLTIKHIYLGKYVSFADEVTVDDLGRGMDLAVREEVLPNLPEGETKFACITHSTGGPVARQWIHQFYGRKGKLAECPVSHLIMLAPANHGSALAQLGKGKLARMKFFLEGVEPGVGVLNWLELGSDQSWDLNRQWLKYDCVAAGLYPFVLTGQRIDRAFYDNLNSYTGEEGSDGVVRVAAANMNYGLVRLLQVDRKLKLETDDPAKPTCMGVLPMTAHTGSAMGIMDSVKPKDPGDQPTVLWVLKSLAVKNVPDYEALRVEMNKLTAKTQKEERVERETTLFIFDRKFETYTYCMLVFRLIDDRGNVLTNYDVIFTAGPKYDPNHLPEGFFVDRQRNQLNAGKLTYYINYDKMKKGLEKEEMQDKFGFIIRARPDSGYARYFEAEHQGTFSELKMFLEPNRTMMIEIQLTRHVGKGVFRFANANDGRESFKKQAVGKDLPPVEE